MTIMGKSRSILIGGLALAALTGCEGAVAGGQVLPQMRALQSQCLIEIPDCRYDEIAKESYCSSTCYDAAATR